MAILADSQMVVSIETSGHARVLQCRAPPTADVYAVPVTNPSQAASATAGVVTPSPLIARTRSTCMAVIARTETWGRMEGMDQLPDPDFPESCK